MMEDKLKQLKSLLESKEATVPLISHELTKLQHLMFKRGIRALVGVRKSTGYFTAETYILRPEQSTAGVPYWEHVFSPFGFSDYNEALYTALIQGLEHA